MNKASTSLEDLIPARIAPQQAPRRQPSRAKTVMIAGHFDADVSYAMRELCGKLTRQVGQRVTMQQALAEALAGWFTEHGAPVPEGLVSAGRELKRGRERGTGKARPPAASNVRSERGRATRIS
jgi:hypothetical protein